MSNKEEKNTQTSFKTDLSEAALIVCIFITAWLTDGDPDLLDALIHWLMRT